MTVGRDIPGAIWSSLGLTQHLLDASPEMMSQKKEEVEALLQWCRLNYICITENTKQMVFWRMRRGNGLLLSSSTWVCMYPRTSPGVMTLSVPRNFYRCVLVPSLSANLHNLVQYFLHFIFSSSSKTVCTVYIIHTIHHPYFCILFIFIRRHFASTQLFISQILIYFVM